MTGVKFLCYTELKYPDVTYCAHPNYRNDGPWYDFVYVSWTYNIEGDNNQKNTYGTSKFSMTNR